MKLRTKAILFFGLFLLVIILSVGFYAQYIVGGAFKKQIANDFFIIAEQSEGTYFAFLEGIKVRAIDWSSDDRIVDISRGIIRAGDSTNEKARLAKEFATYVSKSKMPFDETIFLVDLLDKNGIVVASTRPNRIGIDELKEEQELGAHHFSKTITSSFGSAFVKSFIFEEDETDEPMTHVTARMFDIGADGAVKPLDAVLLLHFANTENLAYALGVDVQEGDAKPSEGRITRKALLESYKTSDIYLVDRNGVLVTPSRYMGNVSLHHKVDTLPVRECIDNGKEISGEYENFQGRSVLGASICLREDGLVLLVEIEKDEIFEPITKHYRTTLLSGEILLFFGVIIIIFFLRLPLKRLDVLIHALERVMNGDLTAQAIVETKDEIGSLASMFNTMVNSIRSSRSEVNKATRIIQEKALMLEKDVQEHKRQEKFLEDSKLATLNLLEDSWKAKVRLEEEGTKLQTILTSIGDGLVIIDTKYKIVLVNSKALDIFSMTQEELIGNDLREMIKLCKKKKYLKAEEWPTEEVLITKKPLLTTLEDDYCITTKGRETQLSVAFSVSPLGGGSQGLVIVIRDITEDKELDDSKSGFISVASHQLRTPLTSIRWYSEMLLSEDAGKLNDAQMDFMKEIHGGAERLYQTVDLLLGISRIESGKLKADRTPIDLGVFTSEIIKELSPQIGLKEINLTVSPPNRESVIVWLDSITLRQVILNLISNSIRYTNLKGSVEVKWWINDDGREVTYVVRDDGIGIPDAQKSRIFSKFFRAENARAQVPDGSGLGLALVKDLIESWGGRIWFESKEGKGATFLFTIPFTTKVADIS